MKIDTGYFDHPETHHKGWFRVFNFENRYIEVWFGHCWMVISR